MNRVIKLIDNQCDRYSIDVDCQTLGRQWDNEAEFIVVEKPAFEIQTSSTCEMFVKANGQLIDAIQVYDKPIPIRSLLSQYRKITIGFSFYNTDGYVKNSEPKDFYFLEAIKPEAFTPTEPEGKERLNYLLANGLTDLRWKDGVNNILELINADSEVVGELEFSGFVQEQSDLGETDSTKETFVKGKFTSNLVNDSGFQTASDVDTKLSSKQDVIADLSVIRSGASAGATAVQPNELNNYYTKSQSDNNLSNGLNSKLDKTGGSISGDLSIQGNLIVSGTTTTESQETLDVKDNFIYTNSDKIQLQTLLSGLGIYKDANNIYSIAYDPVSDSVKLGLGYRDENGVFHFNANDGNPVAVRVDSEELIDGHIMIWDATENKLKDGGKTINNIILKNISDAENNSLIGNDIQTNLIKLNGYIDSSGIWHEITETPILVEDINSPVLVSGYYVIPKSLIENGSFGYALYYFTDNVINRQIKDLIGKNDENSQWLTNTYNYNSGNISAFGSNNLVSGDSSIVAGNNNKNSGYNSLITGKDNTSNAGESVVAGLKNTNLGGSSAVFGCYNNVNDNQGLASGFHNKISTGSLYSTAVGVGNVTKGISNLVAGAYNYTGGDYDTAVGNSNVVGGSITYNNIEIGEIPTYTSKEYNENDLVKLNGFVYKSLMNGNTIMPTPQGTEGYWEIIKPTTAKGSHNNSFAGGANNKITHSNSFVYGKGLQTSRNNQTVIGQYNSDYTNADFIIGNGDSNSRHNSMEVRSSSTATTLHINTNGSGLKMLQLAMGGIPQVELRASNTAVGTLACKGGLYIKPYGEDSTFSDKYGLLMKEKIYPLTNELIDLGAPKKKFKTLYVKNLNVSGTTFGLTNFVLTSDRTKWDNKADKTYVDNAISSAITTALNTEV